ncbi:hypothetical protein [Streptomyces sp. NRRL F-5630]|uniref:hypothetical protein n=1 Tax=Streptomyces sp. NRRL F-5630 TaxID=1463864 RepID=UPI003D72EADD
MTEGQSRPLDTLCPVVCVDAVPVKIRAGRWSTGDCFVKKWLPGPPRFQPHFTSARASWLVLVGRSFTEPTPRRNAHTYALNAGRGQDHSRVGCLFP